MVHPSRTYAAALAAPSGGAWGGIRRPALVALIVGVATAVSSTGHLTVALLVSGVLCWSFVPLLQIATAAVVMRSPVARRLPLGRRLDLWFMGHAAWSLWILAAAFILANTPEGWHVEWPIIASAVIPIAWTSIIAAAFCRVVLGDPPAVARTRTAVHQALTGTIALLYVAYAVALWPRVVAFFGR